MTKEKRSLFMRFILGFVILVGLDQWTKGLAVAHLKENSPFELIPGVFELYYSENRGAAFGNASGKTAILFPYRSGCFRRCPLYALAYA